MADIQLIRRFDATPARLFQAVTKQSEILNWWGHDGMTIPQHTLDFTRTGPWFSEMFGKDGKRYKLSGQVTHVKPPDSVAFTWAWHDNDDKRGAESHVTFTIKPMHDGGSQLTVDHRELPSQDIADHHFAGWTAGPLNRLARYMDGLNT